MKDATVEDFVGAVRSVARGSDVIPAVLTGTLLSHIARDAVVHQRPEAADAVRDRKSTRLNSSHGYISYAVFCLKKKKDQRKHTAGPQRESANLIALVC